MINYHTLGKELRFMAKENDSGMKKVAAFIVDRRNLFFLIYAVALVFSLFSRNWVEVENDITTYLPDDTETRQGLTVMNDNFVTYGSARVMLSNVTQERAQKIADDLLEIDGVSRVTFDDTEDHYRSASALLDVSFDAEETDERAITAMHTIEDMLAPYDCYIDTAVGVDSSAELASEMGVIVLLAAVIIVIVLTLTSKAYMEVPVLIMTFGAAALLNMGTNFLCGKISFISNSVTVVLQLALAIDYAIILCHRFSAEHETKGTREACIDALSKAIPEISSSSLTTISGLAALAFMHFGIGLDMAIVLIKAILLSLLSVFTLMPGLLMLFSNLIDRTHHKNLVPKITAIGKFDVATRFVIPPVFVALTIVACIFANRCPYVYTYNDLTTAKQSEKQVAVQKIKRTFGSSNMVAIIVPSGDYEKESQILTKLQAEPSVKSTMGLASIEAMDGYVLTDALTPRQFSELVGLDYEAAKLLYTAYATDKSQYGELLNGVGAYKVPLFDMFLFLEEQMHNGNITLEGDTQQTLDDLFEQLDQAKLQLQSDSYSRMVVYLDLPEESDETFQMIDKIHDLVRGFYGDDVYVVGNTTSAIDLSSSFVQDNLLISILSALFVMIILLFTFKSAGLPVLLILVIQGSIWMNFSFPAIRNTPLYFLGYLIVNSIQMGANIDYAIVISSHYTDLKKVMRPREAIVAALNESFPTIFTSGSILASAGILISVLTTNPVIAAIGTCLGRGTIVSIILVLFVLPQILILGDTIIERTSFEMKGVAGMTRTASGTMHVNGRVRGYINGVVDADIKGVLHGQFSANIATGTEFTVDKPDMYLSEENIHESEDGAPEPGTPDTPDTDTKGGDAE